MTGWLGQEVRVPGWGKAVMWSIGFLVGWYTLQSYVVIQPMKDIAQTVADSLTSGIRQERMARESSVKEVRDQLAQIKDQQATILKGQEVLLDVALRGVYDKAEIDRFRMAAENEHRAERIARLHGDLQLRAYVDSLLRRRR